MSTWTEFFHGVWHWVLQPSPSITAVLCQRLGRPNSFLANGHMAYWYHIRFACGKPSAQIKMCPLCDSYAKLQKVAPDYVGIPAALSCSSPLTQSLQPNVWHNDSIHIVAQALATTILKCSRHAGSNGQVPGLLHEICPGRRQC